MPADTLPTEQVRAMLEKAGVESTEIVRHDNSRGDINWQIACRVKRGRYNNVHFNSSDLEGPGVRAVAALLSSAPTLARELIAAREERDRLRQEIAAAHEAGRKAGLEEAARVCEADHRHDDRESCPFCMVAANIRAAGEVRGG